MSNLGRRELLTGLAAVAVAGVTPAVADRVSALPISPAAAEAASLTPRAILLGAPWYFALLPDGMLHISHVSGFGFYNAPKPDGSPVFVCRLDEFPSRSLNLRAFEHAATFAARHGYLLRIERQHSGAIYFDYTQRDPRDPFADVYTEDAPPHPDIDRFYQIRFPVPRSARRLV